jgi:hypothetical protein
MLKGAVVTAASTLAVAVFAIAVTGPSAMAAGPKCKNQANKYVACTDKLKAKSSRRTSDVDGRDFLVWRRNEGRPKGGKLRVGQ